VGRSSRDEWLLLGYVACRRCVCFIAGERMLSVIYWSASLKGFSVGLSSGRCNLRRRVHGPQSLVVEAYVTGTRTYSVPIVHADR
jgi:hypothetical protein